MNTDPHDERAGILRVLDRYHEAMVAARTGTLERLLDDEFSLVHITGYVQPKTEWLDVVRSRDFDYHAIEVDKPSLTVEATPKTAVLKGRGIFDATINGVRSPWRLQFTITLHRHEDQWRFVRAKYTSF
jgi:hypothetical protein